MIAKSVARQSGFSSKELRENIKVSQVKDIIIQYSRGSRGVKDEEHISIDEESLDEICDDILNWLVGVRLCKMCADDQLDCFWDDKTNQMKFIFKDGLEFDWTKE